MHIWFEMHEKYQEELAKFKRMDIDDVPEKKPRKSPT